MERYKSKYKDPKIMFLSDMNIVSKNVFWPEVLKAFSGSELLITEASTLSPTRYLSTGKETNGIANDYDHFVLDKKSCNSAKFGKTRCELKISIRINSIKLRLFGQ